MNVAIRPIEVPGKAYVECRNHESDDPKKAWVTCFIIHDIAFIKWDNDRVIRAAIKISRPEDGAR